MHVCTFSIYGHENSLLLVDSVEKHPIETITTYLLDRVHLDACERGDYVLNHKRSLAISLVDRRFFFFFFFV